MINTVFIFHLRLEDKDACWVFSTQKKAQEFAEKFIRTLLEKHPTDKLACKRCEILEYPLDQSISVNQDSVSVVH